MVQERREQGVQSKGYRVRMYMKGIEQEVWNKGYLSIQSKGQLVVYIQQYIQQYKEQYVLVVLVVLILVHFLHYIINFLGVFKRAYIMSSAFRQLQSLDPQNYDIDYPLTAHVVVNGLTWFLFCNLAVLAATQRHIVYMKYIHGICMMIAVLLTFFLAYPLISPTLTDDDYYVQTHMRMGILVLVCLALQLVLGIVLLFIRKLIKDNSFYLYYFRRIHMVMGYFVFGLCKVSGLYMYCMKFFVIFLLLVALEVVFYGVLGYVKWGRGGMDMGGYGTHGSDVVRPITSLNEISCHYKEYGLIGNYVYDLSPLIHHHPGGYQVIRPVLQRDIDRYLLGMCRSEGFPLVPPHAHSSTALTMLKGPIARLDIQSPYVDCRQSPYIDCSQSPYVDHSQSPYIDCSQQDTEFILKYIRMVSQGQLYELSFVPRYFDTFTYHGYTTLAQFGRYRSLTFNNTTRLYTAVNFLTEKNKALMRIVLPTWVQADQGQLYLNRPVADSQPCAQPCAAFKEQAMPIMIKKYERGTLTPQLLRLSQHDSVLISGYKGAGLRLNDVKGRVILVGGGTGCFPFYDLIDMLYKAHLVKHDHQHSQRIVEMNPILSQDPFNEYQFVFIGAYERESDVHSMIYEQLGELARGRAIKCVLKIKDIREEKGGIVYTEEQFEEIVEEEMNTQFSKVIVCGPPKMNQSMHKMLSSMDKHKGKWMIL